MEKQCFACKQAKPVEEFYGSPQTRDGLMTYCKLCHNAKIKAGRETRLAGLVPVLPAPGSLKFCRHCGVEKPIEEFGKNKSSSDGHQPACKPCAIQMVTASRRKNPEGHRRSSKTWREENPGRNKDNNLRWRLGIEHGTYDAMHAAQEGKCAICGTTDPGSRTDRFHVDHCHDTQEVRGLLCASCNLGLGLLKHDAQILLDAIQYLQTPPWKARP